MYTIRQKGKTEICNLRIIFITLFKNDYSFETFQKLKKVLVSSDFIYEKDNREVKIQEEMFALQDN